MLNTVGTVNASSKQVTLRIHNVLKDQLICCCDAKFPCFYLQGSLVLLMKIKMAILIFEN